MKDWQAYLDGTLSGDELVQAEEILKNDPGARAELNGLKAFRDQIKSSSLAEAVPTGKLENNLHQALALSGVFGTRVSPGSAAAIAACLVLLACAVTVKQVVLDKVPVGDPVASNAPIGPNDLDLDLRKSEFVDELAGSDTRAAAKWATKTVHYAVPVINLDKIGAGMTKIECGGCWVAYHFSSGGSDYALYGRKEHGALDRSPTLRCGSTVEIYQVKDGLAWYGKDGMTYVLKGGNANGRETLAKAASTQTDSPVF